MQGNQRRKMGRSHPKPPHEGSMPTRSRAGTAAVLEVCSRQNFPPSPTKVPAHGIYIPPPMFLPPGLTRPSPCRGRPHPYHVRLVGRRGSEHGIDLHKYAHITCYVYHIIYIIYTSDINIRMVYVYNFFEVQGTVWVCLPFEPIAYDVTRSKIENWATGGSRGSCRKDMPLRNYLIERH